MSTKWYNFDKAIDASDLEGELISHAIDWLKQNPDQEFCPARTGDRIVIVFRGEDRYRVEIAKALRMTHDYKFDL